MGDISIQYNRLRLLGRVDSESKYSGIRMDYIFDQGKIQYRATY